MEHDREQQFLLRYAPYLLEGYTVTPRTLAEIPEFDPKMPFLRQMAYDVDQRRAEDPMIGIKTAGGNIQLNLLRMFRDDRDIHAAALAILGALGGLEISRGIMQTAAAVSQPAELPALGIEPFTGENGEHYVSGPRIAHGLLTFCMNAVPEYPDIQGWLDAFSEKTNAVIGTDAFWNTPYYDRIGETPKRIAKEMDGQFEPLFRVYTRFPHERMTAYAFAARILSEEHSDRLEPAERLSILTEFVWRTAHYVWGG